MKKLLCQFILDPSNPSSLNLKNKVSLSDPILQRLFKFSREYCYIIDKTNWNTTGNGEKQALPVLN